MTRPIDHDQMLDGGHRDHGPSMPTEEEHPPWHEVHKGSPKGPLSDKAPQQIQSQDAREEYQHKEGSLGGQVQLLSDEHRPHGHGLTHRGLHHWGVHRPLSHEDEGNVP